MQKGAARIRGFANRPPFSKIGMPAGCGKEASMVGEKSGRPILLLDDRGHEIGKVDYFPVRFYVSVIKHVLRADSI